MATRKKLKKPARTPRRTSAAAKATGRKAAAKPKKSSRRAASGKTTRASKTRAKARPPAKAPARTTGSRAPKAARSLPLVGAPAPDFQLPGDDGQTHSLANHRGQPVVIYFYPKDDTPGCTKEACDFRDNLARAQAKGAVVYGISRDSLQSHERFRNKYQLNFPLLSDEELQAHKAYGAWGQKSLYGRSFEGALRSTFLIDREGKLARAWPKVSVAGHVDEVLGAIEALA